MATLIKKNLFWLILVLGLAGYLTFALSGGPESVYTPGQMTHGHHQIELACTVCHTKGMGVKQESCNQCHAEELARVDDSHPVIKFKDPRNAARLEKLDARYCITCHREHQPELTEPMGLTLPTDYCYFCHQTIGEERPSHKGLGYDTCASAGCHNFHDNTALYERFLTDHLDEPDFKENAIQRVRDFYKIHNPQPKPPLSINEAVVPSSVHYSKDILHDWASTTHASAGVNCVDCHQTGESKTWTDHPGMESCQTCHANEVQGFLEGKHGMRLAQGMSPMTPGMAKIPMNPETAHRELSCVSCHGSHSFDTKFAAVEACLQCHQDDHTLNYKNSPHFSLWERSLSGEITTDAGVSCATCHLPRVERTQFGKTVTIVDHNQNNSLRPNEKMVRSACIQCHGLQFTLNALADPQLIESNFQGHPSTFIDSLEMARKEMIRTQESESKARE